MEYWELEKSGRKKKYLVLASESIGHVYSGKDDDGFAITSSLKSGKEPEELESIPFRYIREITSTISSNKIAIHYKKESKLEYVFNDLVDKQSFYQSIEKLPGGLKLYTFNQSLFKTLKIQIIAGVLLAVYLGWAFVSASAIENGTHPGRDFAIVLLVASLGTKNILYVSTAVFSMLALRVYFKIKGKEETEIIKFLRPSR